MTYGAAAAAVLTAIALVGCGGDEDKGDPIPSEDANRMVRLLELADSQSAAGTCGGATAKVQEARGIADQLPRGVDPEVRRELLNGLDRLAELIGSECERPEPAPEDTTTETTTTPAPTQTQPQPTATQPQPTATHPQPTATQPQPTTTTPAPTPGTGGTPPGQGDG